MHEENKRELPVITVSPAPYPAENYQPYFAEKISRTAAALERVRDFLNTIETDPSKDGSQQIMMAKFNCEDGLHCLHALHILVNHAEQKLI